MAFIRAFSVVNFVMSKTGRDKWLERGTRTPKANRYTHDRDMRGFSCVSSGPINVYRHEGGHQPCNVDLSLSHNFAKKQHGASARFRARARGSFTLVATSLLWARVEPFLGPNLYHLDQISTVNVNTHQPANPGQH